MSHFSIFNSNWGGNGLICWAMTFPMRSVPCIKSLPISTASVAQEEEFSAKCFTEGSHQTRRTTVVQSANNNTGFVAYELNSAW